MLVLARLCGSAERRRVLERRLGKPRGDDDDDDDDDDVHGDGGNRKPKRAAAAAVRGKRESARRRRARGVWNDVDAAGGVETTDGDVLRGRSRGGGGGGARLGDVEEERDEEEEEEEEVGDAEEDVFYAGGTQAWAPDDGTDDDGDAEADEDEEGDAFDWTGGTQAMPPPASPSLEVAAAGTGAVPASVARAEDAPKTASSPKPGQPGFLRVAAKPAAVRRLSARAHDPPATTRDAAEERPAASPLATAPPPVAASDPYSVDVVLSSCAPATGNTQPPACTPAQDVMCSLIPSTFPPPGLQTRGGAGGATMTPSTLGGSPAMPLHLVAAEAAATREEAPPPTAAKTKTTTTATVESTLPPTAPRFDARGADENADDEVPMSIAASPGAGKRLPARVRGLAAAAAISARERRNVNLGGLAGMSLSLGPPNDLDDDDGDDDVVDASAKFDVAAGANGALA